MATMKGMDIDGGAQFSRLLTERSRAVATAVRNIDSGLANTQWVGADATAFRSEWDQMRAQLQQCVKMLGDTAGVIDREVAQQRRKSGSM